MGHAVVRSCRIAISIKIKQKGQFLKRQLYTKSNRIVLPRFKTMTSLLPVPLLDDWNFLFHLATQTNLTLYIHIIDYKTSKVLVRNTFDWLLRISRWQKLGYIVDIRYNNCFLADTKSAFQSATILPRIQPLFEQKPSLAPNPTEYSMETKLHNRIRVYGNIYAVAQLAQLVTKYLSIWEFESFMQILPERWMKVSLKSS